jgi:glutathione peroxidase
MQSFYDLEATEINGKSFPFSQLRGKKVIIVNTASECGFTYQYALLQELYENSKSNNVVVLAFPSNDFGEQEPGTNEEINTFCTTEFSVSFPVMQKVKVLGKDAHSVYQFLTKKENNGITDIEVKWNFQKILIDEQGRVAGNVAAAAEPMCPQIIEWLQQPSLF